MALPVALTAPPPRRRGRVQPQHPWPPLAGPGSGHSREHERKCRRSQRSQLATFTSAEVTPNGLRQASDLTGFVSWS